ncbi:MAG: hypothetical protein OJF51_000325 [Nitrospira sp.]|jgi:hypothetical protein|nr:MAG: hypothetical protein OJF51_000321 [Nitrospira sp.]WHZ25530.1 MAG: hypothetical protein OJF51_000325 [Nitrospira sp.]
MVADDAVVLTHRIVCPARLVTNHFVANAEDSGNRSFSFHPSVLAAVVATH